MASGDEGVLGAGRGDIRAVAETNGEAEEPDLLHNKKNKSNQKLKMEAQKKVTTISLSYGFLTQPLEQNQYSLLKVKPDGLK